MQQQEVSKYKKYKDDGIPRINVTKCKLIVEQGNIGLLSLIHPNIAAKFNVNLTVLYLSIG